MRRVEAGRTNPSLATLVGIAHGLSTDVVDLLGERVDRGERGDRVERSERPPAKTRKYSDVVELLGERVERERPPTKTRK